MGIVRLNSTVLLKERFVSPLWEESLCCSKQQQVLGVTPSGFALMGEEGTGKSEKN